MENSGIAGKIVDAIEDGKIVRVNEEYALREGLFILRKSKQPFDPQEIAQRNAKKKLEEETRFGIDNFRKPLGWVRNQVITELVDNFQWQISSARKSRNITRKQLAIALGERENNIKMVENGLLPSNDFVLINKIESYFNINLRKSGQDFSKSARSLIAEPSSESVVSSGLGGDRIEIFEED